MNIDELYISQPDCGEQALEITETMVRSGAVDIVIVDSVGKDLFRKQRLMEIWEIPMWDFRQDL